MSILILLALIGFVIAITLLKRENDRLQKLLKESIARGQSLIVDKAKLKYESNRLASQLVDQIDTTRALRARYLSIFEEIWGKRPMKRNCSDVIQWIREAREVANYHADYCARLREHYAELEEKYNARCAEKDTIIEAAFCG